MRRLSCFYVQVEMLKKQKDEVMILFGEFFFALKAFSPRSVVIIRNLLELYLAACIHDPCWACAPTCIWACAPLVGLGFRVGPPWCTAPPLVPPVRRP
jgi:hypothetical protein